MSTLLGLIRVLARLHALALLLMAGVALAEDKEPLAIFELGMAGEQPFNSGSPGFGPTAAVEFTPIKNWLEIETGVTALFRKGQAEWDTDFVFKKPFDLSPSVEFEPGVGPVWMHTLTGSRTTNAIGAEVVLDFMFWPTADRRYGWCLEPSYSYSLASGHEQSFGVSGGLLIPIR